MSQYIQLLRNNRGYTKLWLAQVISLTGDWFNTIVLSATVARYSGGSGLAISLFLMARFLPPLLISPFAGVLVDRFDRKQILIWCNALRIGVVAMFLFATTPDTLWLIYVLTIVQFSLSAFFEPAQSAITPSLLKREDLVIANTLASVTWSTMLALGALIGGIVAAVLGSGVAIAIDSLTFAVAALMIALIRPSEMVDNTAHDEEEPEDLTHETGSFIEGLRFMRRNPITAAVALIKGGGSIGNVDLLMTVYATQVFIIGANGQLSLSIMYSAFGFGAIAGPFVLNRINDGSVRRMRRLVVIGFALSVLGWIFFGGATSILFAAMGLFVRAMGGSANWTYSSVIIQKSVPDRYLGRVFSLDFAMFQLATVISTIAHGYILDVLMANNAYSAFQQVAFLSDIAQQVTFTVGGAESVRLIAYATGMVSLVPLVLWVWVLPKVERRDTLKE